MFQGRLVSSSSSFPTPGAGKAQEQMFNNIRSHGARTIYELLSLNPSALFQVRDFVGSPDARGTVFEILDGNGDQNVSLREAAYDWPGEYSQRFGDIDPAIEGPVLEFLTVVRHEMKLETLSESSTREIGVGFQFSLDGGSTFFNFAELCRLTQLFVTDNQVADRLCNRLRQAEAAEARGDLRARDKFLGDYQQTVKMETHKSLTLKNALILRAQVAALLSSAHPTRSSSR